jgi:integrase/recombinase XerD
LKHNGTSTLAAALKGFLGSYLPHQRAYSLHTILSYRDSLKLLLQFAAGKRHRVSELALTDLNATTIIAFLDHIEGKRGNKAATRNVRLSAIHSFFEYVGSEHPEHLDQAQRVLSLAFKRTNSRTIEYLESDELRAIFETIDRSTAAGRRDYALLALMFNTGARVQELVSLKTSDLRLAPPPSVTFFGKGRKERICPLWPETAQLLKQHLDRTAGLSTHEAETVFRNQRGDPLTRFGARLILRKHVERAAQALPFLKRKRIHPHSLRHYLPFLTMSGTGTPAKYFRQIREVAHDIVLTPSISPMLGKGVHREVYYRLPSSSFASAGRPSRVTYRAVCEVTE